METVTKEVYIADDGKEFTDVAKCNEYEVGLRNEVELDEFIESLGEETAERAKSRIRNDILRFLAWRENQEVEEEAVAEAA